MTTESMTPADIRAITCGEDHDGFMGNGAWWIIILFLFMFCGWGGNGFGGRNNSGVADNYVLSSDFANIERKIDGVNNGLCSGFYEQARLANQTDMTVANGFAQAELSRANQQTALMNQMYGIQTAQQNCCCENRAAIADLKYSAAMNSNAETNAINSGFCQTNYNNSNNTRDILDNQNANTRAILDALNAQRLAEKDARIAEQNQQIFGLQLAASQTAQNAYLINALNPSPVPAYTVANPYTGRSTACPCPC